MLMVVEWIVQNSEEKDIFLICMDSLPLCMALRRYNQETDGSENDCSIIQGKLPFNGYQVILWFRVMNLLSAAKNASDQVNIPGRPITLRSDNMQIRKAFHDEIEHDKIKSVYISFNWDN